MTGYKSIHGLERSSYHLLKRAAQFAADIYAANAGKSGLTQRQFIVLTVVDANEGVSQTELVKQSGIDRSTLADMISRLTAQGYLKRKRSQSDARTNVVRLTAAGRRVMNAMQPNAAEVDKKILSVIPAAKRKVFMELLRILANQSEQSDKPAAPKARKRKSRRKIGV